MSSEATDKLVCDFPTDGTCVSISELLSAGDCLIPVGSCFLAQSVIVDEHNHQIDSDWTKDKNGEWVLNSGKCGHDKKQKLNKIMKKEEIQTETDTNTNIETLSVVEQPKIDPVVVQNKEATPDSTITLIVGMLSGVVGNAATPLLKGLVKKIFKKKVKSEEENNEVTDCKTHQISINAKISSIYSRLSTLESNTKEENDFGIDFEEINDLKQRIEKLEKKKK